jgi:alkanesulfonate monooxygenase SsuD/methylene tetrahydromethanopterin reductase-like flavin-dependent oxidoreductase (luciferase family)
VSARLQHIGYFFSRGFGPQGWGRPDCGWGDDWTKPALYQQAIRDLERAGLDLVVLEDAISLGNPDTLDLRVRAAYGGPKHDPLLLAPYLFDVTRSIGLVPTINAGITPPYLAARQAATLQHLSGGRFGINLVTDLGSTRHVTGAAPLSHDAAYDRAQEWLDVVRGLWHSWDDGALVADPATGRFADGARIRVDRYSGTHFDVTGPLNALPCPDDPLIVSPGGSPRGLAFAGAWSDVQLAMAPLDAASVRAHRRRVLDEAAAAGRADKDVRVLFVLKPQIVSSSAEAARVVAASCDPGEGALLTVATAWSSDLETDLTRLELDRPVPPDTFGEHVSRGTIRALFAGTDPETASLRAVLSARARLGRISERAGLVGTAAEVADLIEELGAEADNDGILLSGDLHPTSVNRLLGDLVPELRARGILRREYGNGGLRANLFDF